VSSQSVTLTLIFKTNLEPDDGVEQTMQHPKATNGVQDDAEVDKVVEDQYGDDDDNDGKVDFMERTEHDCCDWEHVNTISKYAVEDLVRKYYSLVNILVNARRTHRTKGAFNLIVFVEVLFDNSMT
jgi:hypothetical protein